MTDKSGKRPLPLTPHPDHLRKEAKARLASLKGRMSSVRLTDVQLVLAREYGFANWGMLQTEVARRSGQGRRLRNAVATALAVRRIRGQGNEEAGGDFPISFFRAGLIAQVGFIIVALVGVAMVMTAGHHEGAPAVIGRLGLLLHSLI